MSDQYGKIIESRQIQHAHHKKLLYFVQVYDRYQLNETRNSIREMKP